MNKWDSGFKKIAMMRLSPEQVQRLSRLYGLMNGVGAGLVGGGAGFLMRSRFEDRLKKDADKTTKDKVIGKAPLIGGLSGAALGYLLGARKAREGLGGAHLAKFATLKPEIDLREHQEQLVAQTHQNGGSILAAHATGVGKTLGGIAAFESLKAAGKAHRALVVVPASLRSNFVDHGIKKFTNSSVATYGPKNEASTKDIGHKSNATYNVVSYDLLRAHGDQLLKDTGADTLIMDEIHRARATEGVTYNKLMDLRGKVKNAITLTGSVVNNDPNEVVPLLDLTYGRAGHKLVSKQFFDKLFVKKDAKVVGLLNTKTVIDKSLKNKPQLSKYLAGKVSFVPHEAVDKLLPKKDLEVIPVNMSPEQKRLYDFSLSAVDPVTRWKIRNNLPVGQREAQDAFGKLMQARQISTDPSILDKTLAEKHKDPAEYSPKVKRVVDDLEKHLEADKSNKSVIYGNLLQGQLHAVERSLKARGIPYTTFYGVGNEGNTASKRVENIKSFQEGNSRVLLISGAGAEGLDLKNANMLQMLEGHYNPERIHQAESRVRRMGAPVDKIKIKRYVSVPSQGKQEGFVRGLLRSTALGGNHGVDDWIYSIAAKKDELNRDFRDVLDVSGKSQTKTAAGPGTILDPSAAVQLQGDVLGRALIGSPAEWLMQKTTDKTVEAKLKQALLDRGYESLTQKRHMAKVLAESKMDERAIDASTGTRLLWTGAGIVGALNPAFQKKVLQPYIGAPAAKALTKIIPKSTSPGSLLNKLYEAVGTTTGQQMLGAGLAGVTMGVLGPMAGEYLRRKVLESSVGTGSKDLDTGIQRYVEKLKKKTQRKYKSSKSFVNEYETKQELGIDPAGV